MKNKAIVKKQPNHTVELVKNTPKKIKIIKNKLDTQIILTN